MTISYKIRSIPSGIQNTEKSRAAAHMVNYIRKGVSNVNTKAWLQAKPDHTKIAWTDSTFNIVWGCTKVSEACKNCYAQTQSRNIAGFGTTRPDLWLKRGATEEGKRYKVELGRKIMSDAYWLKPLRWQRLAEEHETIQLVFSSSFADVFEDHPVVERELGRLWELIRKTPNLHWQLLTKRPERIRKSLPKDWWDFENGYPNVWLGTTVESDKVADRFNEHLADIPAVVKFISYEPAVEALTNIRWNKLDWLIAGGESGSDRRPFKLEWARHVHEMCQANNAEFFYKQDTAFRSSTNPYLDGKKYYNFPMPRPSGQGEQTLSA